MLDLSEQNISLPYPQFTVIETGGMKGTRPEVSKQELHNILKNKFQTNQIHSEYGMAELFSQVYSKNDGVFKSPPWMKILMRDLNDPFSYQHHKSSGGINIIDLANLDSCAFIETQDVGKATDEHTFEILGRTDVSDIRGCNLMMVE